MNELDMAVNIRHIQNSKSLLATASVTLGGCFAVQGIQVREGKNGVFVSMPQRKDAKGSRDAQGHQRCRPRRVRAHRAVARVGARSPARESPRAGQERGEGQEQG